MFQVILKSFSLLFSCILTPLVSCLKRKKTLSRLILLSNSDVCCDGASWWGQRPSAGSTQDCDTGPSHRTVTPPASGPEEAPAPQVQSLIPGYPRTSPRVLRSCPHVSTLFLFLLQPRASPDVLETLLEEMKKPTRLL